MELGLKGKTAIVTGASRGIGKAIVEALASEGVNVVLNYRSHTALAKEAALRCNEKFTGRVRVIKGDVGDLSFVDELFAFARNEFGKVDIVINNAGTWTESMVCDMTIEEFEYVMRVNMEAPFLLSRHLVNHLQEGGRSGSILNVVSRAGIMGSTRNHAHYAASKGALIAFTKSLAREVAGSGITVNAIAPGIVKTDMMMNSIKTKEEEEKHDQSIPIGRMARPEEIADAAVFLVSERARYYTGMTFDASGGILMK